MIMKKACDTDSFTHLVSWSWASQKLLKPRVRLSNYCPIIS